MNYLVLGGEDWWFFKAVLGVKKNKNLKIFLVLIVFIILFECL